MSETVNETGTWDTSGAVGDDAAANPYTAENASSTDTAGAMGDGDNYDAEPSPATQPDTSATQGGENTHREDDPQQYLAGTVSTLEPGSPTQNADPAYRAPGNPPGASNRDTTRTDTPVSDGSEPDETVFYMTGIRDTVNPTVPLQTTTENTPATPGGAPAVLAVNRGVRVTLTAVADPAGAPIRGYRVETSTGGVDFVGRDNLVVVVGTLVPSQTYKFRYAAVNDNGVGAFSAWSAAATPLNPDEAGDGHATEISPENLVNPIYKPDGSTMGLDGPVRNLVAEINDTAGEVDVSWEAPAWGSPVTGYHVEASSGEEDDVDEETFETTLTGLTFAASTTVTVTASSDLGDGRPKTSDPVAATGPPATVAAAATLVVGALKIDWTAPAWGVPTGYVLLLSTGETITKGAVLTHTFTGLSAVSRTCKVTPINASGNGVAKTTNAATPLA